MLAALTVLGGGACGGNQASSPGKTQDQTQETAQVPRQTAAEGEDIDQLLTELASYNYCDQMQGDFLPLRRSEGRSGQPGNDPALGRLWLKECRTRLDGDRVTIEMGGPAWQWVDRESSVAGADFGVSQYVRLSADVEMTGKVDIAYDTADHVVTAWYTPVEPVVATVRPIGDIDVDRMGLWSEVVGGVADLFGQEPAERARERIRSRGSDRFEAELSHGFTVAVNLCTAQRYTTVRKLAEGEVPERPVDPEGRVFADNVRVRLHPNGIDADGSYQTGVHPLNVEVNVEEGGPLRAQLACEQEVAGAVTSFLDLQGVPPLDAKAEQVIAPGRSATLQAETDDCALGLLFSVPEGVRDPVQFTYLVWTEEARTHPLVRCDGGSGDPASGQQQQGEEG